MFQANAVPIMSLPAPQAPLVIYLPEIHSPNHGVYFPELSTGDTSKATIVADIASAQHDNVSRVIAIDLGNGKSWDASKEIAQAVLDEVLPQHDEIPRWCEDFLEEHLGMHHVRMCEQEHRFGVAA